jgi:AhpD family alkylhydroperoxidase
MKHGSVSLAAVMFGVLALPVASVAQQAASSAPPAHTSTGLPYLTDSQLKPPDLVDAIRARREDGKLLNLDRILLQSPNFARAWNTMFGTIRGQLSLDPKLRELVTMAIAVLNASDYQWAAHESEFLAAGGTRSQLAALRNIVSASFDQSPFDETERATLALAVEMTRNVTVQPATMKRIRGLLSDQHVVELIGTIAGYNMVSRFFVATGVDPE